MATPEGAQWDAAGLVARARALILSSNVRLPSALLLLVISSPRSPSNSR